MSLLEKIRTIIDDITAFYNFYHNPLISHISSKYGYRERAMQATYLLQEAGFDRVFIESKLGLFVHYEHWAVPIAIALIDPLYGTHFSSEELALLAEAGYPEGNDGSLEILAIPLLLQNDITRPLINQRRLNEIMCYYDVQEAAKMIIALDEAQPEGLLTDLLLMQDYGLSRPLVDIVLMFYHLGLDLDMLTKFLLKLKDFKGSIGVNPIIEFFNTIAQKTLGKTGHLPLVLLKKLISLPVYAYDTAFYQSVIDLDPTLQLAIKTTEVLMRSSEPQAMIRMFKSYDDFFKIFDPTGTTSTRLFQESYPEKINTLAQQLVHKKQLDGPMTDEIGKNLLTEIDKLLQQRLRFLATELMPEAFLRYKLERLFLREKSFQSMVAFFVSGAPQEVIEQCWDKFITSNKHYNQLIDISTDNNQSWADDLRTECIAQTISQYRSQQTRDSAADFLDNCRFLYDQDRSCHLLQYYLKYNDIASSDESTLSTALVLLYNEDKSYGLVQKHIDDLVAHEQCAESLAWLITTPAIAEKYSLTEMSRSEIIIFAELCEEDRSGQLALSYAQSLLGHEQHQQSLLAALKKLYQSVSQNAEICNKYYPFLEAYASRAELIAQIIGQLHEACPSGVAVTEFFEQKSLLDKIGSDCLNDKSVEEVIDVIAALYTQGACEVLRQNYFQFIAYFNVPHVLRLLSYGIAELLDGQNEPSPERLQKYYSWVLGPLLEQLRFKEKGLELYNKIIASGQQPQEYLIDFISEKNLEIHGHWIAVFENGGIEGGYQPVKKQGPYACLIQRLTLFLIQGDEDHERAESMLTEVQQLFEENEDDVGPVRLEKFQKNGARALMMLYQADRSKELIHNYGRSFLQAGRYWDYIDVAQALIILYQADPSLTLIGISREKIFQQTTEKLRATAQGLVELYQADPTGHLFRNKLSEIYSSERPPGEMASDIARLYLLDNGHVLAVHGALLREPREISRDMAQALEILYHADAAHEVFNEVVLTFYTIPGAFARIAASAYAFLAQTDPSLILLRHYKPFLQQFVQDCLSPDQQEMLIDDETIQQQPDNEDFDFDPAYIFSPINHLQHLVEAIACLEPLGLETVDHYLERLNTHENRCSALSLARALMVLNQADSSGLLIDNYADFLFDNARYSETIAGLIVEMIVLGFDRETITSWCGYFAAQQDMLFASELLRLFVLLQKFSLSINQNYAALMMLRAHALLQHHQESYDGANPLSTLEKNINALIQFKATPKLLLTQEIFDALVSVPSRETDVFSQALQYIEEWQPEDGEPLYRPKQDHLILIAQAGHAAQPLGMLLLRLNSLGLLNDNFFNNIAELLQCIIERNELIIDISHKTQQKYVNGCTAEKVLQQISCQVYQLPTASKQQDSQEKDEKNKQEKEIYDIIESYIKEDLSCEENINKEEIFDSEPIMRFSRVQGRSSQDSVRSTLSKKGRGLVLNLFH